MRRPRHWHATPGHHQSCAWCRYERRRSTARLLSLLVAALIVAGLAVGLWLSAHDPEPTRIYVPPGVIQ